MRSEEGFHPGHHSIRLPNRDYTTPGTYFVTICTHEKCCTLGRIANAQIELTPLGVIARDCWTAIPEHFARVNLHGFAVMPNHIHGLVELTPKLGLPGNSAVYRRDFDSDAIPAGSLSAIVRSFKSAATKRAHRELQFHSNVWQSNYYERVLRDGQEFSDAARYIVENPMKWEWDRENPEGAKIQRSR